MKLETNATSFRVGIFVFILYALVKSIATFWGGVFLELSSEILLYIFIACFGYYFRKYNNRILGTLFIALSGFLVFVLLLGAII
ncbi:hypothetical protein U9J35_22495 [Rossellomorea aquimaris]|nr:hypothetical protein [Rossellomorea aquimaris]WRP06588.1 hypothetical protein U9J35_22495 [Rossellomorea aquimaris]